MNNSVIVNALLSDICISEIGSCWKQGSVMVTSDRYYLISKINHKFVHGRSGWPSGLRRQTQVLVL